MPRVIPLVQVACTGNGFVRLLAGDAVRAGTTASLSRRIPPSQAFVASTLRGWYVPVAESPDDDTGMWIVKPLKRRGRLVRSIISLDTIIRGAHHMGVAGRRFLPLRFSPLDTLDLDKFKAFYVNKFADHHAFEIAF
ncbi:hypothetical protein PTI98_010759 [Pleurotus ostreatus]|nr:hypothetical protein PTI98_010759 [Pleurotus ostreatus]